VHTPSWGSTAVERLEMVLQAGAGVAAATASADTLKLTVPIAKPSLTVTTLSLFGPPPSPPKLSLSPLSLLAIATRHRSSISTQTFQPHSSFFYTVNAEDIHPRPP
jgi:hypothetical protein